MPECWQGAQPIFDFMTLELLLTGRFLRVSVGPKIAIVGTWRASAACIQPVSVEMNRSAWEITFAVSVNRSRPQKSSPSRTPESSPGPPTPITDPPNQPLRAYARGPKYGQCFFAHMLDLNAELHSPMIGRGRSSTGPSAFGTYGGGGGPPEPSARTNRTLASH